MESDIASEIIREVLEVAPRKLSAIQAELLFIEDGRICWGDNKPPVASPNNITKAWEMFISSPFNGHLSSGKSKAQPSDVRGQLKKVVKRSFYPVKDLIATKETIAKLVAAITDD